MDSLPITRLDLVDASQLEAAWQPEIPKRVLEETFEGTEPARTIDFDPSIGYRLYARHFGLALIAPKADRVLCAPPGEPDWSWQRFLVGRVLPWAALLHGREVFHASAVRIGGRAIAIVAASGGGKTSLALQLMLRGAGFVTDDVLALERAREGVTAHPGANILAVREDERAQVEEADWQRLGRVLGTSVKTYVEVTRESKPLPLGAIYLVKAGADNAVQIEAGVDARELLASTFIFRVTSPDRLAGLLDLCADISSSVPLFRLSVGSTAGARAAAEALLEHAGATVGG